MLYIDFSDKIVQKSREEEIVMNTRIGTNIVLWGGLGCLILNGTIGISIIGEMLVIGGVNKITKKLIKDKFRKPIVG